VPASYVQLLNCRSIFAHPAISFLRQRMWPRQYFPWSRCIDLLTFSSPDAATVAPGLRITARLSGAAALISTQRGGFALSPQEARTREG
jgi:hypothetical protein